MRRRRSSSSTNRLLGRCARTTVKKKMLPLARTYCGMMHRTAAGCGFKMVGTLRFAHPTKSRNDERAFLLLPHLVPQPLRHRIRRARGVIAGGAQIGLAHGGDVDLAEQRRQRLAQAIVTGAL